MVMGGLVGGSGCWWVGSGGLPGQQRDLLLERVEAAKELMAVELLVGEVVGITSPGGVSWVEDCRST